MFVKRLILRNFRCYESLDVEFEAKRIYISGQNGIGKTTILEAIYFLTIGRSFRKADNIDLIKQGESEASIYLIYHSESDDLDHTLSCVIGKDYKTFAFDREKVKSLSKILRKLMVVYYIPSLVFFFQEEPESRRKFLDETLSQLSPQYLFAISRYKKLLKERNAALLQGYDPDVIDVLRNELINLSYRIVKDRNDLLKRIEPIASKHYQILYQSGEKNLTFAYKTNSPLESDQETFIQKSIELFERSKSIENIKKTTAIGPHRDDFTALLNKKELARYGSQGENRIASLSLKLAIADEYETKLKNRPILLLDDITSDLDDARCKNLLHSIDKEEQQVFLTGTTLREGYENYQIYTTDGTSITRR